jgi:hypothetical protein
VDDRDNELTTSVVALPVNSAGRELRKQERLG